MASINSKNIFDVVKKKYAPNQPEKNHKIDPVYSLFDRDGTSWNPIPTIGPATATTTPAIFLPTTGVM